MTRSTEDSASTEARSNLTRSQFLIWTGAKLSPTSPLYNMGWRFDVAAALDGERFRRAFHRVVAETDVLRLVVDEADGAPRQRVRDDAAGALTIIPPGEDAEAALAAWTAENLATPFDLSKQTFRAAFAALDESRASFVVIQHHIVADAASGGLLFEALSAAYAEDAPIVTRSAEGWLDIAARQRVSRREGTPGHWDAVIDRAPPPPRLYTRPLGSETSASILREVPLGRDRAARMAALAADPDFAAFSPQLALFRVLATTVLAWISRVAATETAAIGVAVHGRAGPVERRTPGLFMELFPMLADAPVEASFRTLHGSVVDAAAETLKHAGPGASSTAGHGCFNVVLNVIATRFGDFAGAKTEAHWLDQQHQDPRHTLWIDGVDFAGAGALSLRMRFNRAAFDDALAARAAQHLLALLDAFLTNPGARIAEVPLATPQDASAALTQRSDVVAAEAARQPATDAIAAFTRLRLDAPDAAAIQSEGADGARRDVSRAALDAAANGVAAQLAALGVEPGELVGVHMTRGAGLVSAVLGVLKAGCAFAPLDPGQPSGRLSAIAEEAGLRTTITEAPGPALGDWRGGGRRLPIEDCAPTEAAPPQTDAEGRAYTIFTSGSTGRPKGVEVGGRALSRYADWAHRTFAGGPAIWSLHSAIGFDLTITSIFAPLIGGGVIRCYRETGAAPDLSVLRVFSEDAVDVVKLTPAHLAMALAAGSSTRRIRAMVLGGEDLSLALAQRTLEACGPHVAIFNEYGPTEATVGCMAHRFDPEVDREPSVPIGRPAEATRLYVLDRGGAPAADEVVGRLFVGGPERLATGYLNAPEETARKFVVDPYCAGGQVYDTGDLASVRPDGVLRYHGRADDQLKRRGVRIEVAEIRAATLSAPGVEDCAVGFEAEKKGDDRRCGICGLSEEHPDADLDADDVCAVCRRFEAMKARGQAFFRDEAALRAEVGEAETRRRGEFDLLMLLSGGKDSCYALARLAELTPRILVATLDNGYISDDAKANVERVCQKLNVPHQYLTTPHMRAIFADSLERHADVCPGCFKTIYLLAMRLAREKGIPLIATGLSRGQLFETRIAPALAETPNAPPSAIDATILSARKTYHSFSDEAARRLDGDLFTRGDIFSEIKFIDYYRYSDVPLSEIYSYLEDRLDWRRPVDTGRSTNCRINELGIEEHRRRRGFHNYAGPYAWDVRLGHKTQAEAVMELDDAIDETRTAAMRREIGAPPAARAQQRLICHYVATGAAAPSPEELRRRAFSRLPREAVPDAFVPVSTLPLNHNGKVDRARLPRAPRQSASAVGRPPATPTETALLTLWRSTLDREELGVEDNFFEFGGDSIQAITIAARAEREGLILTAVDVLTAQSVAAAAALVDARSAEASAPETAEKPRASLDQKSVDRLKALFGRDRG